MNPRSLTAVSACVLSLATGGALLAQSADDKDTITVPKREFQQLLEEHRQMMQEMKALKAQIGKTATLEKSVADNDTAIEDLEKQIKETKQIAKDAAQGSTKFHLGGYGSATYTAQDNGGANGFAATFNPIFLWKINDKVFFEGEAEFELGGTETSTALEMAHISYIANDYLTVSAGKFLNPANYFVERQHMAWVNKLPDKPLAVYDGLMPETEVGFQARGAVPVGPFKIGYAAYVANAPQLKTDLSSPADLGSLEYNNFDNVGRHISTGGRVGIHLLPEFEIGYGAQYADVAPVGYGHSVKSFLQSVDASYVRDSIALKGVLNAKVQWVWSHIDRFDYDPAGGLGDGFDRAMKRNGGYAQIAYRPTHCDMAFVKNVEFVFRYDLIQQANTPVGVDERRSTVGLDYWIGPSTVVKTAYEFDHQSGANASRHNTLLIQLATGF